MKFSLSGPFIKQIESTVTNMVIILICAPAAGIGLSYLNGELHTFSDLPKALDHGLFVGVMMAIAWLGMASPFAGRFRTLVASVQTPDGKSMVQVSETQPTPGTSTTTTMDPKAGTVTIKETPAAPEPPKQ